MGRVSDTFGWLEMQQDRMTGLLMSWSAVNSHSLNLSGLDRMAGEIEREARRLGFEPTREALTEHRVIDDRGVEVAQPVGPALRMSSGARPGPSVLLVIHYDTVFGVESGFQTARMQGPGLMVGPGVLDAKSGVMILLHGLAAFEKSEAARGLGWEVILNPDEEIGSPGSGPVLVEAAGRHDVGLVFEPALEPGPGVVMAGARKGSQNYTLVVKGKSAHAGRDFAKGRNAGVMMARIVGLLHGLNKGLGTATLNVGPMHVLSPVNVVPEVAVARFNVRFETVADLEKASGEVSRIVQWASMSEGFGVEVSLDAGCPSKPVWEGMRGLMGIVGDVSLGLGQELTWRSTGGVCDGNRLAGAGLPTVDTMGGLGGGLHTPDEHVMTGSLVQRAKLLAGTLEVIAEKWPTRRAGAVLKGVAQ